MAIAGLLGFGPHLGMSELKWEQALEEEGLEQTGFHMSDCAHGFKQFKNVPEAERVRLQNRFVTIIKESELALFASGVMTKEYKEYNELMPKFKKWRGKYAKPYYLAFEHLVARMSKFLDDAGVPKKDTIGFMFDRQEEYEGRAKEIYDALWKDGVKSSHRLGPLCYVNRLQVVQIQAADIVAYLTMRHLIDCEKRGQPASDQWNILNSSGRLLVLFFAKDGLKRMLIECEGPSPRPYAAMTRTAVSSPAQPDKRPD